MAAIAAILILTLAAQTTNLHPGPVTSPAVEQHIRELINELPADSQIRRQLLQGSRGNGVHYPWMDEMQKQEIKKVIVWVAISFDRRGRPKKMNINHTEYFVQYDAGETPVSDAIRLNAIRAAGLEKQLDNLALQRTAKGFWLDVPRPRPHPFVGGAEVEFLDDEWLPVPNVPIFGTNRGGQQPTGAGR